MHNVELKLELRDLALARSICRTIGAAHIATLEQTDTYYNVPSGRLKKRECRGEPTEYVFYDRPDKARARLSHFSIYTEQQALERFGVSPLPVWVVVRKTRELYMLGGVRIHLDSVEGLGNFLEFEALVSPSQTVSKCHRAVKELRRQFAPVLGEVIATGYSDMRAQEMAPEPL